MSPGLVVAIVLGLGALGVGGLLAIRKSAPAAPSAQVPMVHRVLTRSPGELEQMAWEMALNDAAELLGKKARHTGAVASKPEIEDVAKQFVPFRRAELRFQEAVRRIGDEVGASTQAREHVFDTLLSVATNTGEVPPVDAIRSMLLAFRGSDTVARRAAGMVHERPR